MIVALLRNETVCQALRRGGRRWYTGRKGWHDNSFHEIVTSIPWHSREIGCRRCHAVCDVEVAVIVKTAHAYFSINPVEKHIGGSFVTLTYQRTWSCSSSRVDNSIGILLEIAGYSRWC